MSLEFACTPLWAAPEIVRSDGYSSRADIWSFGCVLLEMATAQLPWYTRV